MKRSPSSSSTTAPNKKPRTTTTPDTICIGVLAFQGAFTEHATMLQQAGRNLKMKRFEDDNLHHSITPTVTTREVRKAGDLDGLDGLVIPGGESTAIAKIASDEDVFTGLRNWMNSCERPVWGTCAGLIFMANTITDGEKKVSVVLFVGFCSVLLLFWFLIITLFFNSVSLCHTTHTPLANPANVFSSGWTTSHWWLECRRVTQLLWKAGQKF